MNRIRAIAARVDGFVFAHEKTWTAATAVIAASAVAFTVAVLVADGMGMLP